MINLLKDLPHNLNEEVFENLLTHRNVRVERIVSKGQITTDGDWYDQHEHEWVLVLQGSGELTFEDGSVTRLQAGDHVNIPAHSKHRVSWTDPDQITIWIAVFYQ